MAISSGVPECENQEDGTACCTDGEEGISFQGCFTWAHNMLDYEDFSVYQQLQGYDGGAFEKDYCPGSKDSDWNGYNLDETPCSAEKCAIWRRSCK